MVPAGPGTLTLVRTVDVPAADRKTVTSGEFSPTSADGNDDVQVFVGPGPDPGFRILPETVACVVTRTDGRPENRGVDLVSLSPPACKAWTRWRLLYKPGTIKFRIRFDEVRNYGVPTPVTEDLDLRWGGTAARPVTANRWKLLFVGFDAAGVAEEIVGPRRERFLTVAVEGANVVVSAPRLDTVA